MSLNVADAKRMDRKLHLKSFRSLIIVLALTCPIGVFITAHDDRIGSYLRAALHQSRSIPQSPQPQLF
jgi:uncharacterized protein YggL (DUF469 family)